MSWMVRANINAMEQLLESIYLGKSRVDQVAYQLSPMHCDMMNSMLMSHPQFAEILYELIGAVCPQQQAESETQNEMQNVPLENQTPETEI